MQRSNPIMTCEYFLLAHHEKSNFSELSKTCDGVSIDLKIQKLQQSIFILMFPFQIVCFGELTRTLLPIRLIKRQN